MGFLDLFKPQCKHCQCRVDKVTALRNVVGCFDEYWSEYYCRHKRDCRIAWCDTMAGEQEDREQGEEYKERIRAEKQKIAERERRLFPHE